MTYLEYIENNSTAKGETAMKLGNMLLKTKREDSRDAVSISHKLLIRAGYIHFLSAGIYAYLPLMWKVINKIKRIIREEMEKRGAAELSLPILQPKSIWQEASRWEQYLNGKFLFHLTDRRDEEHCLAPTSEEVITDMIRFNLKSYRDLPLIFYQIGLKFRDELRPRFGLIRTREFIMKDGYSFDLDEDGMRQSFILMKDVYKSIFSRCGIDVRIVEADSGDIGGSTSAEFMLPTTTGEDTILSCKSCTYGANIEKATSIIEHSFPEKPKELEKKAIPNIEQIDGLSSYLNIPTSRILKTLLYRTKNNLVAIVIRGDLEVNERKMENVLGVSCFDPISTASAKEIAGITSGFIGPIKLHGVTVIADQSVETMTNFICGTNETDYCLINANFGRDIPLPEKFVDIRNAQSGDLCPICQKDVLQSTQGIELGHIFQLGIKYSKPMRLTFTNKDGQEMPVYMGCYGLGVSRIAAGLIEQFHDEHGIVWPESIAPYRIIIIPVSLKDKTQSILAEEIYKSLASIGQEVLFDNRDQSPGSKFADADLIGIPWQVIVGRHAKDGLVEIKNRKTGKSVTARPEQIMQAIETA